MFVYFLVNMYQGNPLVMFQFKKKIYTESLLSSEKTPRFTNQRSTVVRVWRGDIPRNKTSTDGLAASQTWGARPGLPSEIYSWH